MAKEYSASIFKEGQIFPIYDKGNILGYYQPTATVKSTYSREELERRRNEEGGFTLEEILGQLPSP